MQGNTIGYGTNCFLNAIKFSTMQYYYSTTVLLSDIIIKPLYYHNTFHKRYVNVIYIVLNTFEWRRNH